MYGSISITGDVVGMIVIHIYFVKNLQTISYSNISYLQITYSDAICKCLSKIGRLGITLGFKGHTPLYGYMYME